MSPMVTSLVKHMSCDNLVYLMMNTSRRTRRMNRKRALAGFERPVGRIKGGYISA